MTPGDTTATDGAQDKQAVPREFLFPGGLSVHVNEHIVTTVLGSCISVCLWDRLTGVGGINHFMLPFWNGEGAPTPKYGDIAITRLVQRMISLQCRPENIIAKVFGGANVLPNARGTVTVGDRNIEVAESALREHGIEIAVSDVGGTCGRKVVFNTRTGIVLIAKRLRKRG